MRKSRTAGVFYFPAYLPAFMAGVCFISIPHEHLVNKGQTFIENSLPVGRLFSIIVII